MTTVWKKILVDTNCDKWDFSVGGGPNILVHSGNEGYFEYNATSATLTYDTPVGILTHSYIPDHSDCDCDDVWAGYAISSRFVDLQWANASSSGGYATRPAVATRHSSGKCMKEFFGSTLGMTMRTGISHGAWAGNPSYSDRAATAAEIPSVYSTAYNDLMLNDSTTLHNMGFWYYSFYDEDLPNLGFKVAGTNALSPGYGNGFHINDFSGGATSFTSRSPGNTWTAKWGGVTYGLWISLGRFHSAVQNNCTYPGNGVRSANSSSMDECGDNLNSLSILGHPQLSHIDSNGVPQWFGVNSILKPSNFGLLGTSASTFSDSALLIYARPL